MTSEARKAAYQRQPAGRKRMSGRQERRYDRKAQRDAVAERMAEQAARGGS
jgi:hypothetical protein